jgi:putative ABC transport system ATP-binding protein
VVVAHATALPVGRDQRASHQGSAHAGGAVLEVQGVTKIYGDGPLAVPALREATFEVRPGEVVLVMGPSGSGKTTLLLLLGAMLRPSAGAVRVAGKEITRLSEQHLAAIRARMLGFVFQDFNLLDALDATENVLLACNLAGQRGRKALERARGLLDEVGLAHRADAKPSQLSGGEQQRVAIARALANDAPLLLADEPTANLDAANGRQVAGLLRAAVDGSQRACVIVTHDDRLVEIADRVLWMEDGLLRHERGG